MLRVKCCGCMGLGFVLAFAGWARAEVWGVKSLAASPSAAPSTLFHFTENGSNFTSVGVVTLGGNQVDVDGLSMNAGGQLFGFSITASGSQLIGINTSNAIATSVGSVLANRQVRGAVYSNDGRLLAIDSAQDQLLEIDPASGAVVGTPIGLTLGGNSFDLNDDTDFAQRIDGAIIVGNRPSGAGSSQSFYSLNSTSGALSLITTDGIGGTDGNIPGLAGLAFSQAGGNTLFGYDTQGQDDIYSYNTSAAYARALVYSDIINSYNSGRGDLAAIVPEPSLLCAGGIAAFSLVRRRR